MICRVPVGKDKKEFLVTTWYQWRVKEKDSSIPIKRYSVKKGTNLTYITTIVVLLRSHFRLERRSFQFSNACPKLLQYLGPGSRLRSLTGAHIRVWRGAIHQVLGDLIRWCPRICR